MSRICLSQTSFTRTTVELQSFFGLLLDRLINSDELRVRVSLLELPYPMPEYRPREDMRIDLR